ncbi:hypothetical protein KIPB_009281, partial [Kipferlia bialata]
DDENTITVQGGERLEVVVEEDIPAPPPTVATPAYESAHSSPTSSEDEEDDMPIEREGEPSPAHEDNNEPWNAPDGSEGESDEEERGGEAEETDDEESVTEDADEQEPEPEAEPEAEAELPMERDEETVPTLSPEEEELQREADEEEKRKEEAMAAYVAARGPLPSRFTLAGLTKMLENCMKIPHTAVYVCAGLANVGIDPLKLQISSGLTMTSLLSCAHRANVIDLNTLTAAEQQKIGASTQKNSLVFPFSHVVYEPTKGMQNYCQRLFAHISKGAAEIPFGHVVQMFPSLMYLKPLLYIGASIDMVQFDMLMRNLCLLYPVLFVNGLVRNGFPDPEPSSISPIMPYAQAVDTVCGQLSVCTRFKDPRRGLSSHAVRESSLGSLPGISSTSL